MKTMIGHLPRKDFGLKPRGHNDYHKGFILDEDQTVGNSAGGIWTKLEDVRYHLSLETVTYMRMGNEVLDNYHSKYDAMLDKIVGSRKFEAGYKIKVIEMENQVAGKFSFIVTDGNIKVHARVIYACGLINKPHYRFIITERE
jgi:hypothetical protein